MVAKGNNSAKIENMLNLALDTTEQETGESSEKTMPEQEPVPMEAFDGAAKDGIGLDAAALAMAQNADVENRNS